MAEQQQQGSNSDCPSIHSYGSEEENGYVDAAKRLHQLAEDFDLAESVSDLRIEYLTLPEFEVYLDKVQGYVKSIDVAKELHSIGRLFPLFHHMLYYPHAGFRAKTTEVVTTMVKNNPRSQKLVMEVNGLQPLLYNFISDPDATSRTKALSAIFALIQNNKHGITAFRLANGYAALMEALDSESVMLLREVLNLILYLLHENSSDNNILIELGFHRSMIYLAYNDDAEVREASLRGLLVLAKDEEGGNNGQLVKNDDEVKKVLRYQIEAINAKAPEDLDVTREEIQLRDSLWNVCYNEPFSLRQKGLLVLPGDVASKLFEPPLRVAWAAVEVADRNYVSEELEPEHEPDVASKLFEPPLRGAWADVADRNSVSEEPDVSKLFEPPLRGAWADVEATDRNFVSEKKEAPLFLNKRLKNENKLKQVVRKLKHVLHERKRVPQERIERIISAMNPEDLSATRVERHLVDSLWNACYNDGVVDTVELVLGTSAFSYYSDNRLFEPPPRARAAADRNSVSEKKEASLLINVGLKNRTEQTFFTSTKSNQLRSLFPLLRTAPNRSVWCGSSVLFGFAKCIRFCRFC